MRSVAAAQADAAGSTPRLNGFSANQIESYPAASATLAKSMQRRGAMPPERRTLSFGSSTTLNSARPRPGPGAGELAMHAPPLARFLAEHHGRARDELVAAIVDVPRRRLLAGPAAAGAAMTPDHGHVVGHDAADVERRPIARIHIL